ncbi:hypothetical protein NS263_06425 [Curtobacterium oceanosedimentum]|uniref:Pilus assembly protein PilO n=1 Tax=Curtobacterium oceanosedimentum TaxID=465820 RepID=A0ABR5S874_9MICO|nr:hypothetical protein [Curtobacterium oceanosedimentum]KTR40836.1 hypothetical protein NS263_06425 [Curtobacterium oceanosedimentum]
MSRNRLMLLVAVMASVVVAVGGFFLGVQPQLARADASAEQQASAEQNNATAEGRIAKLRAESQTLPAQKAELAVLEGSIPSSLDQASFYRELAELADAGGVTISSLTTSDAQSYAPPQAPGTSAEASGTASAGATSEPSASATPGAAAAPAVTTSPAITSANFSAVPVTVGIQGSFAQATAYMKAVQNGKRLFLVSSIVSSSSASGSDATNDAGPTTWTLSGFIYVLQDAATTQAEQAAAASSSSASTNG